MEVITSRSNPLMTRVRKLCSDRKLRRKEGIFLCDGVKMLEEAIAWKAELDTVILSPQLSDTPIPAGVRCVTVPEELMRSISPMEAPQGALFLVKAPDLTPPTVLEGSRYLILDGLQDPGNVGTILRTADAFGCDGLLLTNHCADPLNPKTARATMGAIFRTPVWEIEAEALPKLLERSHLKLAATALREDTVSLPQADLSRTAVIIGSEGKGVSQALLAQCAETIRIPMAPTCESLNAAVAASVVLWELFRRDGHAD
jgi:TrmH family RNA methyltransferase